MSETRKDKFVNKSTQTHNNKYDYSLVEYTNTYTPIIIICPIHGNFSQIPKNHVHGNGCPQCATTKQTQTNLTRYGAMYHQITASGKNKIKQSFLKNYGVDNPRKSEKIKRQIKEKAAQTNREQCGYDNIQTSLISGALPFLTDPNWLYDQYTVKHKSAYVIAQEINCNGQTVLNYLNTCKIPIRQGYNHSSMCIHWLDHIMASEHTNIQHALNGGEYHIPTTLYKADGYCKETNTIYEFYGDYWHGNPVIYKSTLYNRAARRTMGELYTNTIIKEIKIKELGYNLVTKWETSI